MKLNLSKKICTKRELKKFIFKTHIRYLDIFIRNRGLFGNNIYDEGKGFSSKNFFCIQKGYLRGFFANLNYFNPNKMQKTLRKEFELKDKNNIIKRLNDINSSVSVSVHIRRGDLLRLSNAYILPKSYYNKAINYIRKKVKNPIFYFFSDDIEWCKKIFKDVENCVFVGGNSVIEDFELMKNCKHNILANSTLSWWVGYLNYNKNPMIITPSHFGTFKDEQRDDLRFKKWITLDE